MSALLPVQDRAAKAGKIVVAVRVINRDHASQQPIAPRRVALLGRERTPGRADTLTEGGDQGTAGLRVPPFAGRGGIPAERGEDLAFARQQLPDQGLGLPRPTDHQLVALGADRQAGGDGTIEQP